MTHVINVFEDKLSIHQVLKFFLMYGHVFLQTLTPNQFIYFYPVGFKKTLIGAFGSSF